MSGDQLTLGRVSGPAERAVREAHLKPAVKAKLPENKSRTPANKAAHG